MRQHQSRSWRGFRRLPAGPFLKPLHETCLTGHCKTRFWHKLSHQPLFGETMHCADSITSFAEGCRLSEWVSRNVKEGFFGETKPRPAKQGRHGWLEDGRQSPPLCRRCKPSQNQVHPARTCRHCSPPSSRSGVTSSPNAVSRRCAATTPWKPPSGPTTWTWPTTCPSSSMTLRRFYAASRWMKGPGATPKPTANIAGSSTTS